jgi:hypothetical protein
MLSYKRKRDAAESRQEERVADLVKKRERCPGGEKGYKENG